MNEENSNSPIVLLLIENFGLSSAWAGNAVLSANPTNFYSMWERHPHTVIYPSAKNENLLFENDEVDLGRISTGHKIYSEKEFIDREIDNNQFSQNEIFGSILGETAQKNSSLHLIGSLDGKINRYSEIKHLLAILKLAKEFKIFNVYLHLILGRGLEPKYIEEFLSAFNKENCGEIASVVGQDYIGDENDNTKKFFLGLETLLLGRGKKALSPEQALSLRGLNDPSTKYPTSVVFRNRFVVKFNNFDTVIFFNHNNKSLKKLIVTIASENKKFQRIKMPRFLRPAVFFSPFDQELPQLSLIYRRQLLNTIPALLSENKIDQLLISDSKRTAAIENYFIGHLNSNSIGRVKELFVPIIKDGDPGSYNLVLDLIIKQLEKHLAKNEARFYFVLLPALSYAEEYGFGKCVETIKLIDKYLLLFEKTVSKHNGKLILTSDHGSGEKLSERNSFELLNGKTKNPVPFILSLPSWSGEIKPDRKIVFDQIIYDMIKKKHFTADIAPTILELFGLSYNGYSGKSFLQDLKIKIRG